MAVVTGHTCNSRGFAGSYPLAVRQSNCPACQRIKAAKTPVINKQNADCSFCGYRDLPEAVEPHLIGIDAHCPLRARFSGWISVNDRIPSSKDGAIIVTNNLIAVNAHGKKSHVWISTTGLYEDSTEAGSWCIFTDSERRISFVSHWRPALPEEWTITESLDAEVKA